MRLARYTWASFSRELLLLLAGVAFSVPLYLLVTISLKTTSDAYVDPLAFPADPNWGSYSEAATGGVSGGVGVGRALLNSAVITVGSVLSLIAVGSIAAYTIARRRSRLGTALYLCFVIGIIVPYQIGLVPLFVAMRNLEMTNSYLGMIVLYTGLLMPLTVFLYTGFVRSLPRDYEEAAQVDGASRSRTFLRVVLPLLLPVTGTVAVLTGLIVWNDFFVQLIFLSGSERVTLPVAVYSLAGANVAQWNVIFAAVAISIAPVLAFFIFAQRTMVRGFTGGIRG
jgi:raffinose/stachyose/melibiose transport system permease protein